MITGPIPRIIESLVTQKLGQQKVLLIFGSRRTGKTFLMNKIYASFSGKKLKLNGEDLSVQRKLKDRVISNYVSQFAGLELLCIDEAQHIPEVGMVLKMIIDHIDGITVIATGSSSFDLYNKSGEPLTGRSYTFPMYTISMNEISEITSAFDLDQYMREFLLYGSYPEIFQLKTNQEKQEYLHDLVQSYLLKDILAFEGIRNASKVKELLLLLAYQMGNEVSLNELSKNLSIHKNTVDRLLDLLEKNFIIFSLGGYGSNLRKEVTSSKKYYFFDNGIRNALIGNFNAIEEREDKGALFESFIINERKKKMQREKGRAEWYFWRTYDQQEIDLIELKDGKLHAFECKWNEKAKWKYPQKFADLYPTATLDLVTRDHFKEIVV